MPRIPTIISNPDGSVRAVNLKKIAEMPYQLLTNVPNNIIAVPANQASPQVVMSISGEGPAAIHTFAAQRTGVCRVFLQIQDGNTPRGLMNTGCHIDTIFGNYTAGSRPYYLPEALYIDETRAIVVSITDISGVANNVRLSMEAQRLLTRYVTTDVSRVRERMEHRQYLAMPYFYTFDTGFVDIPAVIGSIATGIITVGQDHHFELFQLSAVSTGLFDINITNQQTGESIVDAPLATTFNVSSGLMLGNASFPLKLHEPRLFEVHSKLAVTLTNRIAGVNRVFLTLGGRILADRMWR